MDGVPIRTAQVSTGIRITQIKEKSNEKYEGCQAPFKMSLSLATHGCSAYPDIRGAALDYDCVNEGIPSVPCQALREIRESVAASASETIVVQHTRRWRACDAGYRAQIFVDGPQIMVC